MRWTVLLLCIFTALTACIPIGQEVLQTYDDWLGTTSFTTNEREIFRDANGKGLMTARPVIVMGPQGRAYGVLTNVRRRDATKPVIDRITSGDVTLRYTPHDRRFTHCLDGCQPAEVGALTLSEAAFRRAAVTGLPLRVWGLRDRYDGIVPSEAFARVLEKAESPP